MSKWEKWDEREKKFKERERGVSNTPVRNTLIPFYVGVGVGVVLMYGVMTLFGLS